MLACLVSLPLRVHAPRGFFACDDLVLRGSLVAGSSSIVTEVQLHHGRVVREGLEEGE